jgi:hypothetical protein
MARGQPAKSDRSGAGSGRSGAAFSERSPRRVHAHVRLVCPGRRNGRSHRVRLFMCVTLHSVTVARGWVAIPPLLSPRRSQVTTVVPPPKGASSSLPTNLNRRLRAPMRSPSVPMVRGASALRDTLQAPSASGGLVLGVSARAVQEARGGLHWLRCLRNPPPPTHTHMYPHRRRLPLAHSLYDLATPTTLREPSLAPVVPGPPAKVCVWPRGRE